MAGRKVFARATLALVAATMLGCVNLDKGPSSGAHAGRQVPSRGAPGSNIQQGASAFAANAGRTVKRGSQVIASKLRGILPKSKSSTAAGERLSGDDPTSLAHDPGPLGADLFIAAARLAEKNGHLDQATHQYQKALQANSRNRNAYIGLARLQHRKGQMQESIRLYREALNVYPHDAVILNDLGLCYARSGQLDQAINVLRSATQAAPDREMYQNNLAAALVEANRAGEAVAHLSQTYGPAIANYNVGYLLNRSGRQSEAAQFLARAIKIDPTMQQARMMLDRVLPQVSALPNSPASAPDQYSTGGTPPVYRSLPSSPPHGAPAARTPASLPARLPEHPQDNPQRIGPFGFLPKQDAKTQLVSYEEPTEAAEKPSATKPVEAAVVSFRRQASQAADEGRLDPPEPEK